MKPEVSVIITAFDRKKFLMESINSVIHQNIDRKKYEIIVSKNFLDEAIDKFMDANNIISVINKEGGIGQRIAEALNYCNSDIVCFLEDDDLYSPEKLQTVLKTFKEIKNLAYYHNSIHFIDINGKNKKPIVRMGHSCFSLNIFRDDFGKIAKVFRSNGFFNMSSICISKSYLLEFVDYLRQINYSPDFFLFIASILSKGDLYFDTRKLTRYRVHISSSLPSTHHFHEYLENRRKVETSFMNDSQVIKQLASGTIIQGLSVFNYLNWMVHNNILNYGSNAKTRLYLIKEFLRNRLVLFDLNVFLLCLLLFVSIFTSTFAIYLYFAYFKVFR